MIRRRLMHLLLYREYMPAEYHVVEGIGPGIVFIDVPKVASTAVREALINTARNHRGARVRYTFRPGGEVRSKFKFAFVRNPFDRLVSCYADKVLALDGDGTSYSSRSRYNKWVVTAAFGANFHSSMSFNEFVSLVARIPDSIADAHFRSQYSLLCSRAVKPDYVGRFETLNDDWNDIATRYGLAPLQLRNTSQRKPWEDYYASEATVRTVWNRYKTDVETFHYDEEYRHLLRRLGASP